eukprot:10494789-Lingulodinium_polyedra.AAC.1
MHRGPAPAARQPLRGGLQPRQLEPRGSLCMSCVLNCAARDLTAHWEENHSERTHFQQTGAPHPGIRRPLFCACCSYLLNYTL